MSGSGDTISTRKIKKSLSDSSDDEDDYPKKVIKKPKKDVGHKLIKKMGWKEGQGLGAFEQGDVEVIPQSKQKGRRGLGYSLSDIKVDPEFEWDSEKEKQFVSVTEEIDWMPPCRSDIPDDNELRDWFTQGPKKLTIDDEDHFCDPEILRGVVTCKTVFDNLSGDELRKARSGSNPFETIEKAFFQNRAALKMANMDAVFDFMFTDPVDLSGEKMVKQMDLLYFADICAGPGGFSEYVLWRKKWHAKGFGFTLKAENDFKLEEFFAGTPETFEPHYGDGGAKGDGDIYKPENLIAFRNFVLENSDHKGVHFVMADGGFSVEGRENIQEIMSKRLYLCQFCCALAILRTNGSFVCKLFDILTPFSVGLIYLMYLCFEKVTIHKPNSSRPANSERYIICKWKKENTSSIEQYLFMLNCHLNSLNDDQDINEVVPFEILNDDIAFREYIVNSNNKIGRRQILFLSKVKAFAENQELNELRQGELRRECLRYWKIPIQSRVAPFRIDPHSKFNKLMTNETQDYFAHKAKVLLNDNFQRELQHISSFKCMILGVDEDEYSLNNSNCRGFFLGLGNQIIYYWNGSSTSKWTKLDCIKLELPPETLLYGEIVQEMKGEGKAQKRNSAFHVIDVLFIGGESVLNECFEVRISFAKKMVKAVTKPTQTEHSRIRVKDIYNLAEIENIFDKITLKECKNGPKERFCYEVNHQEDKFIIPRGLLIVTFLNEPWSIHWSKTQNKFYYFNRKNGKSLFEIPNDAITNFKSTFSNRLLWKWNLIFDCDSNLVNADHLKTSDVIDFIKMERNK